LQTKLTNFKKMW